MNLAFGVLFLGMAAGAFYIASHGLGATTPWGAFSALMSVMRGEGIPA